MLERRLLPLALTLVIGVVITTPRSAHAQPTRTVTGVVVDNDAGTGVANAAIQVKDAPTPAIQTGADGAFAIAKAPVGDIVLQIAADTYAPLEITVKAGKTSTVVAIYLQKKTPLPPATRVISGLVRDGATNAPLAGAIVKVQGTELGATTDDDGVFVIPSVAAADVVLEIAAADHNATVTTVPSTASSTRVALAPTTPPPPPVETPVAPTSRTVRGKVTEDASGDPVPGAAVTLVGTTNTVLTDETGAFAIEGVPLTDVSLAVEAGGFKTVTLRAPATVDAIDARLAFAASEEVFVEGRAPVIMKSNLANGASVVNDADLNRVSAPTLDSALQGKISGANIQYNSGAPGGGAQLRLRGISTINGQSSPLYVVDGVIVSNTAISSGANAITGAAAGGNASAQDNPVNRIADLNPNDIESVEVLKGAAAGALYGSKAANGVVVITTKHGRGGKNKVSVTQRFGMATTANHLGSRTFKSAAEVMAAYPDNATALAAFKEGRTYDHEAEVEQVKVATETVASASGGNAVGSYFGSMLVRDEPGVVIGTGYQKQSGRLGINYDFGKRLKVAVSANVLHSTSDRGLTNNDNTGTSEYVVLSSTPSFFNLQQSASGLFPRNPFVGSGANPLQTVALLRNQEDVWRLIGASNVNLDAWHADHQAVTLQANYGFDWFRQRNDLLSPPELFFEPTVDGLAGTSIDANSSNLNWNVGGSAVWAYEPADQKWKSALTGGFTIENSDLASVYVVAQNLTAGQPNVDSGTSIGVQENRVRTRDQGLYLQEEVAALNRRLSVLAGLLGERSSLNGNPDKFYLFPKLAATYEVPGLEKQLDLLRLRGAYGEAGNRPNYGQKFTPLNATGNIGGNAGIVVGGGAGDPNIAPERQREVELGVDVAAKNNRAVLELTAYQRDIRDLLLQRTLAPSTGFTTQFFNGGSMRNRGLEAALQVVPVDGPVEWTSRAILTLNRSTITSLPDGIPYFDITAAGFGTGLGAYRIEPGKSATQIVATVDGMGTVKPVGNGEPTFRVGFANNLRYKSVGLTSLIDWQQGSNIVNLTRLLYDFGQVSPDYVGAGEARLAKFNDGDARPYIESATFVKLREISVFWDLPQRWSHAIGPVDTLRLSLSGRNLLTFTSYSGLDPEVSNFGNQPIGRNYDVAPYPPSRSFWLSLDAGF
ncbi:MAG: SusC/RagA family TonB-linked outer membrane protein [Deltaproteobacteria bacterium]|nr:SusC/RagA family TonB-linked outer membrane protein [Deltaproteobacteria bacterium]